MNFRNQFIKNNLRIEKVIHIGLMCINDHALPDVMTDAFDEDEEIWKIIGVDAPEIYDDKEEIFHILSSSGKLGFLVEFATPVRDSWGHYTSKWIYADSFDECCTQAMEWLNVYRNKRRPALSVSTEMTINPQAPVGRVISVYQGIITAESLHPVTAGTILYAAPVPTVPPMITSAQAIKLVADHRVSGNPIDAAIAAYKQCREDTIALERNRYSVQPAITDKDE